MCQIDFFLTIKVKNKNVDLISALYRPVMQTLDWYVAQEMLF